jgi:uncharacterized cupin superfamily protein
MELDVIAPFPAGLVLEGESESWESVIYRGDFVVSVFAASPAVIDINETFPYDEFAMALGGEITLTNVDGGSQTYEQGDTFLVPKGWRGTREMPVKYREMIIIETDALLSAEY